MLGVCFHERQALLLEGTVCSTEHHFDALVYVIDLNLSTVLDDSKVLLLYLNLTDQGEYARATPGNFLWRIQCSSVGKERTRLGVAGK